MSLSSSEELSKEDSPLSTLSGPTFDLSSKDLSSFPSWLPSGPFRDITKLLVDFNLFVSLPDDLPLTFPSLRTIDVSGNELEVLPHSLGLLEPTLETLNVDCNILSALPDSMCNLARLRVLRLRGNKLTSFPEDFGKRLSALEELHVDDNRLTRLPSGLPAAKSLRVLETGGNRLSSLPTEIGRLEELRVINVSNNCLVDLPDSFGLLPNVELLDISSNRIECLPEKFASCCQLKGGFFSQNRLCSLPDWIGCLKAADELDLSDNWLQGEALPSRFGEDLKCVKYLNLSGNQMTVLPDAVAEMECLEELRLGSTIPELERRAFQNGNWLSTFPPRFGCLKNLKLLQADENRIIQLPESFGLSLLSLNHIDLAQNTLAVLPHSFCDLIGLTSCRLSQNKLRSLPQGFGQLSQLVHLFLDRNCLSCLPGSFCSLTELKSLDLFDNQLTEIPLFLSKMVKLVKLDIDGNHFKCRLEDVPSLVCTRRYAPRSAKDGWRGHSLPEHKGFDGGVESVCGQSGSDEKAKEAGEADSEMQAQILTKALAMSQSLWRSHKEAVSCRQHEAVQIFETCLEKVTQFDDFLLDGEASSFSKAEQEETPALDSSAVSVSFESDEDWDKEAEEVPYYPVPAKVSPANDYFGFLSRPTHRLTRQQRADLLINLREQQQFYNEEEFYINVSLQTMLSISSKTIEETNGYVSDGQFDDC